MSFAPTATADKCYAVDYCNEDAVDALAKMLTKMSRSNAKTHEFIEDTLKSVNLFRNTPLLSTEDREFTRNTTFQIMVDTLNHSLREDRELIDEYRVMRRSILDRGMPATKLIDALETRLLRDSYFEPSTVTVTTTTTEVTEAVDVSSDSSSESSSEPSSESSESSSSSEAESSLSDTESCASTIILPMSRKRQRVSKVTIVDLCSTSSESSDNDTDDFQDSKKICEPRTRCFINKF